MFRPAILTVFCTATLAAGIATAETRLPADCQRRASLPPAPATVLPAQFRMPPYRDTVRITYLDHAEFVVEAGNVTLVTDYVGYLGDPSIKPDVVTMNHAHSGHYTDTPDPLIPHVLRGWPENGRPARHDLDLGAMRIRNVTTDLYGPATNGAEPDGNSIFLIEAAGLCIAHLGHLHTIPTDAQYAAIGRLDVVMVPVDEGYTMDIGMMRAVLSRTRARILLPMHWYSEDTLANFLDAIAPDYDIVATGGSEIILSPDRLPATPTVLLLDPAEAP